MNSFFFFMLKHSPRWLTEEQEEEKTICLNQEKYYFYEMIRSCLCWWWWWWILNIASSASIILHSVFWIGRRTSLTIYIYRNSIDFLDKIKKNNNYVTTKQLAAWNPLFSFRNSTCLIFSSFLFKKNNGCRRNCIFLLVSSQICYYSSIIRTDESASTTVFIARFCSRFTYVETKDRTKTTWAYFSGIDFLRFDRNVFTKKKYSISFVFAIENIRT